jgi:hypothetical protein
VIALRTKSEAHLTAETVASRKERTMQKYSDFYKTLHDETSPTGYLGRGTHYSVLRAVVFHDQMGKSAPEGQFADFAVIWDEDHDTRVMEPIEEIYRRGLLSSFLAFGERKGFFTAVLSTKLSLVETPFEVVLFRRVEEQDLSVRSTNFLRNNNIVYIGDLVQQTEGAMLRTPNFGRNCLNEIKEWLASLGLHLGTKLQGWPPDNIEGIVRDIERSRDVHERVEFLKTEINAICESLNDPWRSDVVALASVGNPIISDEGQKVSLYLRNLEMLWRLGIAPWELQKSAA